MPCILDKLAAIVTHLHVEILSRRNNGPQQQTDQAKRKDYTRQDISRGNLGHIPHYNSSLLVSKLKEARQTESALSVSAPNMATPHVLPTVYVTEGSL